MFRVTTLLARRRESRASRRTELAVRQAIAAAPTVEAAHEIEAAAARR